MRKPIDLRAALKNLGQYPKDTPEAYRKSREGFVKQFPVAGLTGLTLDDYAQGKVSRHSFCYLLEFKDGLGLVKGGAPSKWGVYWKKGEGAWWFDEAVYESPAHALSCITQKLQELMLAAGEERFAALDAIAEHKHLGTRRWPLRTKPLYFYYPEEFLPIHSEKHITQFLEYFGQEPQGGVVSRNRQLLQFLRGLPQFKGYETQPMMQFLYDEIQLSGAARGSGRSHSR